MELIARQEPDLVCLPECVFTGYLYEEEDLNQFAEPITGPTVAEMARIACKYQVYLCFGFLERTTDGIYSLTKNQVCIGPFPLTSIGPCGSQMKSVLINS
jgi:predicted amidohydrolase